MNLARLAALGIIGTLGIAAISAQPADRWQQPAAALAGKIADLVGPGQAHLTLQNLSSIPGSELHSIQKLIADDLRARGVSEGGANSATAVRVTFSESAAERLWIAEVIEGDDAKVAMVDAGPIVPPQPQISGALTLRRVPLLLSAAPVLASLQTPNGLVVLEPEQIAIYTHTSAGWGKLQVFRTAQVQLSRDPRGILSAAANGQGFDAWLPGQYCTGSLYGTSAASSWTVDCQKSDDPWLITRPTDAQLSIAAAEVRPALPAPLPDAQSTLPAAAETPAPALRAFYNAARNYFTGVVVPNPAVNIPPFYSAAFVRRAAGGVALLIGGIDGKLQMLDNGSLAPINGARDWGSDFAALQSGCGPGTQIIASGSGQAISDSLRAYYLPAREAIPASEPITMNGSVTALSTAPDGKSVLAVVRTAANQYEVDRVSATCN